MIQYFPIVTGSLTVNGDLIVTGTGSMSASLALNSNLLQGTGSTGFATTASLLAVSSSQQQISASLLTLTASYTALSSSYTALSGSYNTFSGSASTRITVDSASLLQVSSSQQQISASLLNVVANYATTGSNSFRANQSITGSLVVSSTITAQTLIVQTVTSSIVYSSGSNLFGSALGDRQTFTGSVNITGSSHAIFGNVGIGIASPAEKIHVFGSSGATSPRILIQSHDTANATAGLTLYGRDVSNVNKVSEIATSGSDLSISVNSAERMRITSGGNVGIGTTQPTYVLDVFNSVEANARIKTSSTTGLSGLYIGNGNRDYAIVTRNSQGNVFEFRNETANVTVMSISGSNVGIGTTIPGPGTKLDVRGIARIGGSSEAVVIGSYTDTFTGYYSTVTSNSHGDLTFGSNLTVDVNHQLVTTNTHGAMKGAAMVLGGNNYTLGTNTIAFFAQSSGAATAGTIVSASAADMVIKAGGNVGIGVTNPTAKLEVNGTIYSAIRSSTIDTDDGVSNNFQGYGGYWALRTDLSNNFNLDVYGNGTPKNALNILQTTGAATFSNTVSLSDVLRINASSTTSVSTSATTISTGSNTYGGLAIVWGNDASGNIWTDLLFYSLGQVYVIRSQDVSGGPFGRTYTVNGSGSLRLTMGGGTYTVRYQALLTS